MQNILVIKTGALGDVLRTTVILQGLKEKYPRCKITWFTSQSAKPLLNSKYIHKIITNPWKIPKKSWFMIISLEEDEKILRRISETKFNKLFGLYMNNGVKYTADSNPWNDMGLLSRFGKEKADTLKKKNKKSYPKMLYQMLGLKWKKQKYFFELDKKQSGYVKSMVEKLPKKNVVGVVVGAGKRWPMKSLPKDKLVKLIDKIPKNKKIIILSGPEEQKLARKLKNRYPHAIIPKLLPINEYSQVINLCNIIIAPDSLAMHLGIALNKKVIAYFTVTPAEEIEIYKGKKIKAIHKDYASFSRKNNNRPNITDRISIRKIITAIK